ncbi:hypothetical protein E2I00_001578 [Balaenoptera physalus]|uniref:Uncharacterized protein n=1 Tax=Balaenoptera physalus TaxID=9770 RepID=A0A6A1QEI6_BALPH|nr:hypothetical protein E2I00_001578 [Balaenoptera physalus]
MGVELVVVSVEAWADLIVSFQIVLSVFGTFFQGDERNTSAGICQGGSSPVQFRPSSGIPHECIFNPTGSEGKNQEDGFQPQAGSYEEGGPDPLRKSGLKRENKG